MSKSTQDIAIELVSLLKQAKNVEATELLHAEHIEVTEADPTRSRNGKTVVLKAMQDFADAHDYHYTKIEGPLVSGKTFVIRLVCEAKNKLSGQSFTSDEIGVYTVEEGKIVREQFFYD